MSLDHDHGTAVLTRPPKHLDYSLTGEEAGRAIERGLAEAEWYQCPVPRSTMRQLLDEDTVKLMAEKGIWWSLQPFIDDGSSPWPAGSPNRIKQLEMFAGTDNAFALAKKHKVKIAVGTDKLFDARAAKLQNANIVLLTRWFTPAETLRLATSQNAELLALSGPRNPYPGKLGVIEPGALADLLIVEGDPIADIKLLADPASNIRLIMKDGRVYKNTLPR
ncbi:MAG TPA: amidohydrolase family protein [Tepidisphaeraceae bacterium]|nr:amidohydrolase family protein [Tepidisphaeraceae bacterium]